MKERYSASLLFQYRVEDDDTESRLCEDRIVVFEAESYAEALRVAERKGKKGQFSYRSADGRRVFFEFVAVTDLLGLGESSSDEVWYDIFRMQSPMERREQLNVRLEGNDPHRLVKKRYVPSRCAHARRKVGE